MEDLLSALKAIAEPTRLRIVAATRRCELTVSDLCHVLGQSQPRVSRHLKLLCEADVLTRHSQGTRAFYRPAATGQGAALLAALETLLDETDPTLQRDLARVEGIRVDRSEAAQKYFAEIAADWDRVRTRHVSDEKLEAKLLDLATDRSSDAGPLRDLLDIGTGTGRMLELFASHIDRGLGVDLNPQMLDAARSRLDQQGLTNCAVRQGNVYNLDVAPGEFDVAVLHHVLHFLDDPETAVREAAASVRPDGKVIIVDFAPHDIDFLRTDYAHHRLGFAEDEISEWCRTAGLIEIETHSLTPKNAKKPSKAGDSDQILTVTIWVGTQNPDAPSTYRLEAAS